MSNTDIFGTGGSSSSSFFVSDTERGGTLLVSMFVFIIFIYVIDYYFIFMNRYSLYKNHKLLLLLFLFLFENFNNKEYDS